MDILKVYRGEIRVYNEFYSADVGIINTMYQGWVKVSYMNCEVEKIEFEMLNTAVLSARMVVFINSEGAGLDPGDVEEATAQDITQLIDSIYEDSDDNGITENAETIHVITHDYYDHQPLYGDEDDFGDKDAEEATDQEVQEVIDNTYPEENSKSNLETDKLDDEEEEATEDDINSLLKGIYND